MVAPATKGGLHFLARRAVVWFYTNWRLLSIHRRPTTTLAPKGETTHYDLCVALLLQIMFAVHARGASNLSPLRTFGPAGRQPSSPQGLSIWRPPQPSAAKPLSNLRTLGAIAPSNFRTLKPHRGLSIRSQRYALTLCVICDNARRPKCFFLLYNIP